MACNTHFVHRSLSAWPEPFIPICTAFALQTYNYNIACVTKRTQDFFLCQRFQFYRKLLHFKFVFNVKFENNSAYYTQNPFCMIVESNLITSAIFFFFFKNLKTMSASFVFIRIQCGNYMRQFKYYFISVHVHTIDLRHVKNVTMCYQIHLVQSICSQ